MTVPHEEMVFDAGSCWYGMQKLPGLLEAFARESDGVKAGLDIEYIHRMRVASRRLRAALPLFGSCFPDKQYRKWMQEISRITKALGDARDADVQIAFLEKTLKKIPGNPGSRPGIAAGNRQAMEPAIRFLLESLQKKRSLLQKRVITSLSRFENSRVAEEMTVTFTAMSGRFRAHRKKPPLHGIPPVASLRISRRLSDLLSYDPWITNPEAVAEHHAARIAAKKLRYTMEIYGSLYRNNLVKPLVRVKKIQEILGDIHDCDVWIDQITAILLRERTLLRTRDISKRPDTSVLSSLRILLNNRETERRRRYRQFVRYWQSLARARFWDELGIPLNSRIKVAYRAPGISAYESAMEPVDTLAGTYPAILPHSRHVTNLALMLFDDLVPLHNLGEHDRFLLQCAGELHDIGLKSGERGHNRSGAEMVFSAGILLFDTEERAILSFIICSHRGKIRQSSFRYLACIPAGNRERALMLASVLRIADGLDYRHSGSVREAHCILSDGSVYCTVTGTGDISMERERARVKADLFRQVSGRIMVIR